VNGLDARKIRLLFLYLAIVGPGRRAQALARPGDRSSEVQSVMRGCNLIDRVRLLRRWGRLEDRGGNCRVYLVITDPGVAEFWGFALDLVVFDRGGTIMRRLAAEVAPLRLAKTSVKVFDISETACGATGSILVNDVIHCRDKSGDPAECVDRLSTSSKLAVSLLK